jgi:hypothetical protein
MISSLMGIEMHGAVEAIHKSWSVRSFGDETSKSRISSESGSAVGTRAKASIEASISSGVNFI